MRGRTRAGLLLVGLWIAACGSPPVGPTGVVEFEVVSEGFNVQNLQGSVIRRNGRTLASSQSGSMGRGFNVAAIDSRSGNLLEAVATFDTYGSRDTGTEMTKLTAFIARMPNGTVLLIVVHDEAGLTSDSLSCLPNPTADSVCCRLNGHSWTDEGLRALEALGATAIRRYCYRNSYAFIAVKGSGAKAEQLVNGTQAVVQYSILTS